VLLLLPVFLEFLVRPAHRMGVEVRLVQMIRQAAAGAHGLDLGSSIDCKGAATVADGRGSRGAKNGSVGLTSFPSDCSNFILQGEIQGPHANRNVPQFDFHSLICLSTP